MTTTESLPIYPASALQIIPAGATHRLELGGLVAFCSPENVRAVFEELVRRARGGVPHVEALPVRENRVPRHEVDAIVREARCAKYRSGVTSCASVWEAFTPGLVA